MDNVVDVQHDSTEKSDVNATLENGDAKSLQTTESDIDNTITNTSENSDATAIIEDNQKKTIEEVDFKVIFNKTKHDIVFGWDDTVKDLKAHLEKIIGVPQNAQKLIIKGMARDEVSLRKAGVVKGGKVMLVGSKIDDILSVTSTPQQVLLEERAASHSSKEPLSVQKIHQKVLDKGVPPDAMPALKDIKESLPPVPLSGMLNKHGGKVRLTFKPEQEQLWLGTKERTEKLAMTSIKNIVSEPIKDHEEYHIMGLQLGPTEASRYWVYWVPAQYVEAIKDTILGKWQFF